MNKSEESVRYRAFGRDIYGPAGLSLGQIYVVDAFDVFVMLQLRLDDALCVSNAEDLPALLHDVEDFPGGPKFYVWRDGESVGVQYDRLRARLMTGEDRINFGDLRAPAIVDVEQVEYENFRFSLAMERVF